MKKINKEKRKLIADEIRDKISTYEYKMTPRLTNWMEIAELYTCRESTASENRKNTPNSAELRKAVRAMTAMIYRMLTSQKPFFELEANDIISYNDPKKILLAEHYVRQQLELSKYNKNLLRAIEQTLLYGTCPVLEVFRPVKESFLGRPRFVTSFEPISLINCAFALDAYDINDSSWVAVSNVTKLSYLETIKRTDPKQEIYDTSSFDTIKEQEYKPEINQWVRQRMSWALCSTVDFSGGMEHVTYYGPLDCLNDGENYAVEVINKEFVIRCERYDGIRPIRIATFGDIDVEPMGNGLGDLFRPLLRQMDETNNSIKNTAKFLGANMFVKSKEYGIEDAQTQIRNFGIIELDGNIAPFGPNPNTLPSLMSQYANEVQQFRQASGAIDTLQAIVQGDSATATEVSLAMNEAVRNLSVISEMLAEPFVREHIKVVLQNAQMYQKEAVTIMLPDKSIGRTVPVTITPDMLLVDLGVRVKTMTDQDFRPSKINHELQALQLLSQMQASGINGYKVNAAPVMVDVLKTMDIPQFDQVITPITEQDLLRNAVVQQMMNNQAQTAQGQQIASPNGETRIVNQTPGRIENRQVNAINNSTAAGLVTPVGRVLEVPGDNQASTQAIRNASVGTRKK